MVFHTFWDRCKIFLESSDEIVNTQVESENDNCENFQDVKDVKSKVLKVVLQLQHFPEILKILGPSFVLD